MTISKKQLEEAVNEAAAMNFSLGRARGKAEKEAEFNNSKASAQRDILKASAELAQANAKLTYAMSRMIAEKGW